MNMEVVKRFPSNGIAAVTLNILCANFIVIQFIKIAIVFVER